MSSLFAAEQGIISRPWEHIEGEDWWQAVNAALEVGASIPEYEPKEAREPVSALPFGQLHALDPEERERAVRKRGLKWPTTDESRNRLRDDVMTTMRHAENKVIDAPTVLGKTHTVAPELWFRRTDVTGTAGGSLLGDV